MSSEFDDGTPIEDGEQLVEYFRAGATSEEERGVGTEHEKFAFRGEEAEMMAHCESGGIGEIFER
ncbi:MAG: glutamate--cysteine ligase, partial [Bradymonadaceae bacterium]